ncbi:ABC transporter ATP-binding protein [Alkalicoccus chagannorensis]|uniref:ABC transporter ATP-binding protein n=1 Tax=Alkalicoccus chagannorensis TaxID=427072 RepID=UPI0004231D39|nr:ABC transporter ATP-binding protein [Alkalicoccus chagannorensis]
MSAAHPDRVLDVRRFSFAFEEVWQLQELTFHVNRGEMLLLSGASGTGKSTLALCINGLYPEAVEGQTEGSILLNGRCVQDMPKGQAAAEAGVVFQDPESQFCMMKVEDELAFVLENQAVPQKEMDQRITDVLTQLGISSLRHREIHTLSGGEKQKTAAAAVLLMEPDLLILDEPTANLDPVSAAAFAETIHALKEDHAILLIEHQPDAWLPYLDRVCLLDTRGGIRLEGKPETVFSDERLRQEGVYLPARYTPLPPQAAPPVSGPDVLELQAVSAFRSDTPILSDINLRIQAGTCTALTGQNGAGKSTLLQVISALLPKAAGRVMFLGQEVTAWQEAELRRKTGYVFQQPEHQFITDTVKEELTFSPMLNGHPDPDAHAAGMMQRFGLEHHGEANPFTLSGGQKRRLSTAVMLDETPELLLLDEPTFGQDAASTTRLMEDLHQLQQQGTAVLLITHDMRLVHEWCSRVIVLHDGSIAFDGSPAVLWREQELLQQARLLAPEGRKEKRYG